MAAQPGATNQMLGGCDDMTDPGRRRVLSCTAALLLSVYGCATSNIRDTPQEKSADAAISSKVKSALAADARVRAALIEVTTSNGIVRLSGFADSRLDADAAVSIANNVPGVKRVQNDIVIRVTRDRRP
jgi:osmotically-inducible protein OsmY